MPRKPALIVILFLSPCLASALQNLAPASANQAATRQASITGYISDATTGKSLEDVHVQLIHLSGEHQPQTPDLVYGAMSMGNGLFSILAIKPGNYLIRASRNGLVQQPGRKVSDNMLVVKMGEQMNLDLKMTSAATLSGVVLDEYGDPLSGIYVVAEPSDHTLLPGIDVIGNGNTDDRGQFRFVTTPGKYRLKTQLFNEGGSGLPEIRTDGTQPAKYRDVYFPGTESSAMAAIVDVKPGEEHGGIEFHLVSTPALSITGFISNPPANLDSCGLDVTWGPTPDRMQSGTGGTQFTYGPDAKHTNKFALGDLKPGSYRIRAHCQTDAEMLYSQVEAFNLTHASVENVALHLSTAFEVTGTLVPRRLWPQTGAQPKVQLQATDGMFMLTPPVDVALNGSFIANNIFSGRYRVSVEPLPENAFLQSIQTNGSVTSNRIVDLPSSTVTLKIIVSDQGAEVSGTVRDQQGQLQPLLAVVFLQSEKEEPKIEGTLSSRVDGQGKFDIKAVPPGTYRLFALDYAQLRDGATADAYPRAAGAAEILVIKPGARITKDLKVSQSGVDDAGPK